MPTSALRFRVIGPGRAGRSLALALETVGWTLDRLIGRADDPTSAATGTDLLVLAVPDRSIAEVAASVAPGDAVVVHLAGSRPLTDLRPHVRVGSLHPLVSLPDPDIGAARLLDRCDFAIDGDPIVERIVAALGGVGFVVGDDRRARYHATAAIASNHLVALAAQVERLAESVGVPAAAYWRLMDTTLDNVGERGARAALTGPAARGDWATIQAHLRALPPDERALYGALSRAAATLAGLEWPPDLVEDDA